MRIVCSIVLVIPMTTLHAQDVRPRELPGGGVASPDGKTGYFPNATGGIDGIDLAKGAVLWSSKDASQPLLATASRVFAQTSAGKLRVVALDAEKNGKRVFETQPIALPEWASIGPNYGRSFQSRARLAGNDLTLAWEARAFYAGGAAPPREILEASRKEASGVVRIDVESGKLTVLDAKQIAAGKYFPLTGDPPVAKAGELNLLLVDEPAKNPKNPFQQRRLLQATTAAGAVVWQREIAAPVFLPPPP
jgi:hypothetical protein